MGRGKTDLSSYEYDEFLASKKKFRELRDRNNQRRSKGFEGWHFGLGETPVHTKNKEEFKHELDKRGLMMRDEVRRDLR